MLKSVHVMEGAKKKIPFILASVYKWYFSSTTIFIFLTKSGQQTEKRVPIHSL